MSTDTKAIIGTIVAVAVSLGGLLSAQFAGVNARIDDLRANLTAEIIAVQADLSAEDRRGPRRPSPHERPSPGR